MERKIDNSGPGAEFLKEESARGKLPGGRLVMPETAFKQPPNGAQNAGPGGLNAHTDITSRRIKSGNDETDLSGGLY